MAAYQRQLEELIGRSRVTGASFAYWDGGRLHAAAAGQRNSVTGDPLTSDTIMLIGSITKVFTATLVMQLVDDGLIDLADPVIRHLPGLRLRDRDALGAITCGMLLNHTSGIDGELLPDHGPDQERIADAIARFADLGQLHPPGGGPSYCNAGCVIAGYLAQQLRGQSWYALIASRIFQPLELNHALADLTDLPRFRCSVGDLSGLSPGKLVQTTRPFLPLSFAPAGATLMMSAGDLVNFARALTNDGVGPNGGRVLSAASARRMTLPTADVIEPAGTRWGLGWALHPGGVVCHNGGGPGIFASLYAHPRSGRVLALLTNSDTGYNAAKEVMAPIVESWTGNIEIVDRNGGGSSSAGDDGRRSRPTTLRRGFRECDDAAGGVAARRRPEPAHGLERAGLRQHRRRCAIRHRPHPAWRSGVPGGGGRRIPADGFPFWRGRFRRPDAYPGVPEPGLCPHRPCKRRRARPMSGEEARPTPRAWYALFIVTLATLFGLVDRQILVFVMAPLKLEMRISDARIGVLLGLGPGIFTMVGVIALGWLADRTARQLLLAACVIAWSIATAACGLAHTYHQLLLGTIAIALGEAALTPVFVSMVPDLFPGKSRVTANVVYFGAIMIGAGAGLALGGGLVSFIEAHRASLPAAVRTLAAWRLAFLAVAAPGLPIAAAVVAMGPVRRIVAKIGEKASGSLTAYLRSHGAAILGLFAAASLYNFAFAGSGAWISIYVMRTLGASAASLGAGMGLAGIVGTLVGLLTSWVANRLLNPFFGALTPFRIFEVAMLVSLAPLILLLWAVSPWQAYVLTAFQTMAMVTGSALTTTLLQDVSPALVRGRLVAILTLVSYTLRLRSRRYWSVWSRMRFWARRTG